MAQSMVTKSYKDRGALADIVVRFTSPKCYTPVTFVKELVGLRELLVNSKTPFPSHFSVEKQFWSMYLVNIQHSVISIDYIFIAKLSASVT